MTNFTHLEQKAKLLRKLILTSTTAAGSGHATSSLSAVELGTVLFDKYFTYDLSNPLEIANDRFVLSKGHASPLFYALYSMSGAFPIADLKTLRKFDSPLEGHPTSHFKYTDAATGSLGQGLSVGNGLAYLLKNQKLPQGHYLQRRVAKVKNQRTSRVFVMLGDGECAEGQIWEAANFASYHKLHNLVVIADINRLGQSQETMFGHHMDQYRRRFEAFGFETVVINGHDFAQIDKALEKATTREADHPFIILAETVKGKGISFLEDKNGWHGKALKKEELEKALVELGEVDESERFELRKPSVTEKRSRPESDSGVPTRGLASLEVSRTLPRMTIDFQKGEEVGTREVYGKILASLGEQDQRIYSLDADMKNSTFSEDFLKAFPDRFIECFIAEQNMVGVAMGLSRLGEKPFVSTFASFLVRAADQIRMAAISNANIAFVGAHVGVSIGEDGPSQMGLEDIALFGTIPDSIVLQPSDAVAMTKLIPHLLSHEHISYIRMLRPKTPVLYGSEEEFVVGGSKILRTSDEDVLTVAGTGITVHEALKAAEMLSRENIHIRVVDCYSIKPVDKTTLQLCLSETLKPIIVTVEDHFEHGGFGDFVLAALNTSGGVVHKMAVDHISRSGTKEELLSDGKIDANAIVQMVRNLLD